MHFWKFTPDGEKLFTPFLDKTFIMKMLQALMWTRKGSLQLRTFDDVIWFGVYSIPINTVTIYNKPLAWESSIFVLIWLLAKPQALTMIIGVPANHELGTWDSDNINGSPLEFLDWYTIQLNMLFVGVGFNKLNSYNLSWIVTNTKWKLLRTFSTVIIS